MNGSTNLRAIMADVYGTGAGTFSTITVYWAAARLAATHGVAAAKKELSELNRVRERNGLPVAVPAYGDPLF